MGSFGVPQSMVAEMEHHLYVEEGPNASVRQSDLSCLVAHLKQSLAAVSYQMPLRLPP